MNQAEIDALANGGTAAQSANAQSAPPQLNELGDGVMSNAEVPLAMLMDLTLPLSIELGRTRMTVQDILRLGRGSVVQLERLAGEPIDLYVADRRFAEGEVVVLGEHFGVRITRIIANVAAAEVVA
jgi:flagellar motor switch protein FliN/FliY